MNIIEIDGIHKEPDTSELLYFSLSMDKCLETVDMIRKQNTREGLIIIKDNTGCYLYKRKIERGRK